MRKKTECIGVIIAVASLCLSLVALVLVTEEKPIRSMTYFVQADSTEYYRLYVMVNGRTVIADSDKGLKLYSLTVENGDRIRINAECPEILSIELEDDSGSVVTGQEACRISLEYTVGIGTS